MTPTVVVATVSDSDRWQQLAELSGCPSHRLCHGQALAASGLKPMLAAVISSNAGWLVMPIYCRAWKGTVDIATIPCVSGARCSGHATPLLEIWHDYARNQGWICGYLQFDPLSNLDGVEGSRQGSAVWIHRLENDIEPLADASKIIHRKIRKTAHAKANLEQDRNRLADALCELYPESMKRVGAHPAYLYTDDSLRHWALNQQNLVIGVSIEDCIAGIVVFLINGDDADFHIGAYSLAGRACSAWLMNAALEILNDSGIRSVNLGGGIAYGDGLYQFKQKLGGIEHHHAIITQIYNQSIYLDLCSHLGGDLSTGRFPPYRPQ